MSATQCRTFLALLALLTIAARAEAGNVWDGGGANANWDTPDNWDANTLPAFNATSDIVINTLGVSGNTLLLNGDRTINSLSTSLSGSYSINNNTLTILTGNIAHNSNNLNLTINSNLSLGANGTLATSGITSGTFVVNGNIGETGGSRSLTKTGPRSLSLFGTNTYTGQTFLNGGLVSIQNNVAVSTAGPLGNSASTVVLGQTATDVTLVLLTGANTFARDIEVSAAGSGGARINGQRSSGNQIISGNIAMNRDLMIYANNGASNYTDITGIISGAGNLTLERYVRLSQAHTYTGTTTLQGGSNYFVTLAADAPSGLPGAFGNATSDVVISAAGLYVSGAYTIDRNLSITGSIGLTQSGAGAGTYNGNINMPNATTTTLSVINASGTQVFNGVISGQGGLLRNGGQSFDTFLNNPNNSYTGTTEIRIGDVIVGANAPSGSNGALGNSTTAILFNQLNNSHDSSLLINGAFEIGRDISIVNSGGDDTTLGGITAANSTFSGNISINAGKNALLTAATGGQVTFSGDISGAGNIRKIDPGNVILSGDSSYTGTTIITTGTLIAASNNALGAISTGTTVNSGTTLGFQGNVNYTSAELVSVTGNGVSSLGAIRNISGQNSFAGPITMTGSTMLGADAGQLELTGVMTDGAGTFNLSKVGAGTVSLASSTGNSYNGTTTVSNGTLLANNTSGSATGSGSVFTSGGGILGGTGIVDGNITALAGGIIAPGNSAGTLTTNGNLAFTNNTSQFVVELSGSAADQLVVNGTVNLSNATLNGSVFGGISTDAKLFLLVNDDVDAIIGTFDGLANGDTVGLGTFVGQNATAQISYFGDFGSGNIFGGNDIVLYNFIGTQVPEPSSFLLLGLGLICIRRVRRKK